MPKRSNAVIGTAAFAFLCAALAFAIALIVWSMRADAGEVQAAEFGGTVVIGVCPMGAEIVLRRNGIPACGIIVSEVQ